METHQVRYFLALCETLNFTKAAESCHVSQPSLTRAIKGLEDELGGPLFHRERNQSHLTDLGRIMRPYLQQVWNNLGQAKKQAVQFAQMAETPLTIGIMCSIGPTKLVDLFRDFHEHHPGVELYLRDATAEELQEALARGDLDVALYCLPGGIDERFHVQPLFSERYCVAVAPGHPFALKNAVRIKELDGMRYLVRMKCEAWPQLREALKENGAEPKRPYRSERDDWIQAMILAGLGFGFFPECAVTMDALVTRPLIEPEITRTISLVTVRGRPHSPAVGAFVREAVRHKWDGGTNR